MENYNEIYFKIKDLSLPESTHPNKAIPSSKESSMIFENNHNSEYDKNSMPINRCFYNLFGKNISYNKKLNPNNGSTKVYHNLNDLKRRIIAI